MGQSWPSTLAQEPERAGARLMDPRSFVPWGAIETGDHVGQHPPIRGGDDPLLTSSGTQRPICRV